MVSTVQSKSKSLVDYDDKTEHLSPKSAADHRQGLTPPSNLIALSPEQTEFVNFSVGCPVFYNIRFRGERNQLMTIVDVTEGTVQSASLDMVSRKFWYSIKRRKKQTSMSSNESETHQIDTVIEDEIIFATKCPILLDGTIEGEILHFKPVKQEDSEAETFHYTVLYFTEDDRLRIEEGISAGINGRIKYRATRNGQQGIPQNTACENRANNGKASSPLKLVNIPVNDDNSQNEVSEISDRSDVGAPSAVDVDHSRAEISDSVLQRKQQPVVKHTNSKGSAEELESAKKNTFDNEPLTRCEVSRKASNPMGNKRTTCRKDFKSNNISAMTRPKTIHSNKNVSNINTDRNNTNERAKASDSSGTSNNPIGNMLPNSASKSAPVLGSLLQSRQSSPSSIHTTNHCNAETPDSNGTASTTSESRWMRANQRVEHPRELDIETVEEAEAEKEEVIYISSSESLFSEDHKSLNGTEIKSCERNSRKESNPMNVSTASHEHHQKPSQPKNSQITQCIPRKRSSVGNSNSLSLLTANRDMARPTAHDPLQEPLTHPRSTEHQMLDNPSASRKRQLVNNSQKSCNSLSKVPKCEKSTALTLVLTIPPWVNHKQLCSKFLQLVFS
ncbi:hypothetical protein HJC23_007705 [Cyclotella cryptica]|uniref:Uncharacterized protein n=1 Tax=Cyclotella cryptica TaxID=29204 RepID=A0ABD3PC19_9STRA